MPLLPEFVVGFTRFSGAHSVRKKISARPLFLSQRVENRSASKYSKITSYLFARSCYSMETLQLSRRSIADA